MEINRRKMAEGWVEQASTHLWTAKERVNSYSTIAESIQAAQHCIELSVKAFLMLLDLDFNKSHGWSEKQLSTLAEQINKRGLLEKLRTTDIGCPINLPRLCFLVNFWSEFYLLAKYGMEAGNLATPRELFEKAEAELAIRHAEECLNAASAIRYLPEEQMHRLIT